MVHFLALVYGLFSIVRILRLNPRKPKMVLVEVVGLLMVGVFLFSVLVPSLI